MLTDQQLSTSDWRIDGPSQAPVQEMSRRRRNVMLIRSAQTRPLMFSAADCPRIAKHAAIAAQNGRGYVNSEEADNRAGLLSYYCAHPHTDNTGIVYILPLIAHSTKLHVGTKIVEMWPGDVVAFDDYVKHWTRDTAPCVAVIYACGAGDESPEFVLPILDAYVDMLRSEVTK
jgi:hypothetical protein